MLRDAGARPGYGQNADPTQDRFGRRLSGDEKPQAGDVVLFPPESVIEGTSADYTVDKRGHVAIITKVSGDNYTVLDQDGHGGKPRELTVRIPDRRAVSFDRPVYP